MLNTPSACCFAARGFFERNLRVSKKRMGMTYMSWCRGRSSVAGWVRRNKKAPFVGAVG